MKQRKEKRRRRKITSFDSLSSLWSGRSEAVQGLTVSVSICGSYNKHLKQIGEKLLECKRLGIRVLIPKYAIRKYSTHGFVYLKGENGTPRQLQERNFRAIAKSSFVLVVNPKGYIGPSTALEVGYAYAKGIPVFCTEIPRDYIFKFFTANGVTLQEIKSLFGPKRKNRIGIEERLLHS